MRRDDRRRGRGRVLAAVRGRQRARELPSGPEPLLGIDRQRDREEPVVTVPEPGQNRRGGRARIVRVRPAQRHLVLAAERRLPGERLEEQAAERVQIAPRTGLLTADLLGREVTGGADDPPGLGQLVALVRRLGDAEVGQIGVVAARHLAEQHVGRLDVSVHEPGDAVDGVEGARELGRDRDRALGDQSSDPLEYALEVLAVDPLHRQVQVVVLVADVVHGDDVGMIDRRGEPRLAQKPLAVFGHPRDLVADHLERDDPLQRTLTTLVDDTHAARPGHRQDLEIAKDPALLEPSGYWRAGPFFHWVPPQFAMSVFRS